MGELFSVAYTLYRLVARLEVIVSGVALAAAVFCALVFVRRARRR